MIIIFNLNDCVIDDINYNIDMQVRPANTKPKYQISNF